MQQLNYLLQKQSISQLNQDKHCPFVFEWAFIFLNRVATGFSPTAPTPPIMRVRNGRFTNRN
ncbi:MAG: hypothetical protein KZQ70_07935, partial [gamma proteobacterium symbiont of Lucinoma myriamae]|nr:hypothetical protein [gamma proteobacterium symbiont of Lucinoma myriamae]